MNTAYISIGSNMENRLDHLTEAVKSVHSHDDIVVMAVSSIYETAPVGYTEQADFLNLVIGVETTLEAPSLLEVCQEVEQQLGRVRKIRWGPRTVDLDILLYNSDVIETENLIVPHPRMVERAFVLVPLLEIAPTLADPVTGELLIEKNALHDSGVACWRKTDKVEDFLKSNN